MSDELLKKLAWAASGFQREDVITAAMNLVLNALRQSHKTRGACEEAFDDLLLESRKVIRSSHYRSDDNRNDRKIILPPAGQLFPQVDGEGAKLLDRFHRSEDYMRWN